MTNKAVTLLKIPGLLPYKTGLQLQHTLWQQAKTSRHNYLIVCQHSPVYTFGKRQTKLDLAGERTRLEALGAECHVTNRGGLTTFHGPGQLVCYPILNLRNFTSSARWYVNCLEETVINTCGEMGVRAERCEHVGIWAGTNKICALGVNIQQRCTTHGLALNCDTALHWFDSIVPCGIAGRGVTSVSEVLGRECGVEEVTQVLLEKFSEVFECKIEEGRVDEVLEGGLERTKG